MRTLKNGELRFTISDIKYFTEEKAPHYFSRKAMKFFRQTMKDFSVLHIDSRVFITAPINNNNIGITLREFVYNKENPMQSELRHVSESTKHDLGL